MKALFKKLFNKELNTNEQTISFLQKTTKLAKKRKVEIFFGSREAINDLLLDPNNYVYLLVLKGTKFNKPKHLKQWFMEFK